MCLREQEREKENPPKKPAVRYSLEGYTEHQKGKLGQQQKWVVLYESQEQLERFIDDALDKKEISAKIVFLAGYLMNWLNG